MAVGCALWRGLTHFCRALLGQRLRLCHPLARQLNLANPQLVQLARFAVDLSFVQDEVTPAWVALHPLQLTETEAAECRSCRGRADAWLLLVQSFHRIAGDVRGANVQPARSNEVMDEAALAQQHVFRWSRQYARELTLVLVQRASHDQESALAIDEILEVQRCLVLWNEV